MNLLAVDTAGKTAAVAVLRDDTLLYEAPVSYTHLFHGNCDCTPGNIFVNQLYHLLALGQSVSKC